MIGVRHDSNIDAVIAEVEAQAPAQDHVLEVLNDTEYAKRLHDRTGYWVLNDRTAFLIARAEILKAVEAANKAGRLVTDADIEQALDRAGEKIVAHYQQHVGTKDTRGRFRGPPRPQHPGGWADDSGRLADGYAWGVDDGPEKRRPHNE